MKVYFVILSLFADKIGTAAFKELWELIPEARRQYPGGPSLDVELPIEDGRVEQTQSILAKAGWVPYQRFSGAYKPNEYSLELRRVYESSDWDAAELFEPKPIEDDYFEFGEQLEGTKRIIELRNYTSQEPALSKQTVGLAATGERFLVSDALRRLLQDSGLQHLIFREVHVTEIDFNKDIDPVPLPEQSFWELTTDFIMPSADWTSLRNKRGEPYSGDPSGGCYRFDGFFKPAELHYRRSDIQKLPPFGLGLTREGLGPKGDARRLIASKSFYELFKSHGIRMNWTPVRLDG
jgi:hypothetical protein